MSYWELQKYIGEMLPWYFPIVILIIGLPIILLFDFIKRK